MDWIEICISLCAAVLLILALTPRLRAYRLLNLAAFALVLSAALSRRSAYLLAKFLPAGAADATHVPAEVFGIAWWILGAWLARSLLTLVLRRTLFPDDNQPHARRLYADLAAVLIYLIAFAGIMDTVVKQPISNVLATSGVLAILLGLALQSTLADVFSGLAINIERPFSAGDWVTLSDNVEGQVIEINWRATHIRMASNDTVVIPNSVIAKAIVTNHRRVFQSRWCTLRLTIDFTMSPLKVMKALQAAAVGCPGIAPDAAPLVYARDFSGSMITYEVYCGVALISP
jgi:small-conductance mechanosensitive channel